MFLNGISLDCQLKKKHLHIQNHLFQKQFDPSASQQLPLIKNIYSEYNAFLCQGFAQQHLVKGF